MKRILAALLSAVLCLALFVPALAESTPTELTIFMQSTRPMNEHTEKTRQWVADTYGVDMNLIQGSDNFKQQLALYITSGDIPDLMVMDYNTYMSYASEGVFADITDEVGKYENLVAYQTPEVADRLKVDGRQYGFAAEDTEGMYAISLRLDWLEKLGLEVPATLDEMAEVMRAFTFDDPDGNGADDTYGYGGMYLWPFFGGYGVMPGFYSLNEDNKVMSHSISEEYRASLAYLRDLYAEHIIDPETFTMTTEQQYQKWVQGQMGIFSHWWTHTGNSVTRYAFYELQPDGKVTSFDPPTGPDGLAGMPGQDPIAQVAAISYKATPEKIEAALKILDAQANTESWRVFMYGPEGEYFEMDHEKDETTWAWTIKNESKSGENITDMEVYKILRQPYIQGQTDLLTDQAGAKLRADAFVRATQGSMIFNMFIGLATQEYQELNSEVEAFTNEMKIRFILGEASLEDDWDDYVENWKKTGGESIRQSQLTAYNEMHGTDYTFAD